MKNLLRNMRYAIRQLIKSPVFALTAALTLALGIGANSSIMALGASRPNVVKLVLKEALLLAMVGLGLGLVGSYFVGRAMKSTLYGVGSLDYTAIAAVALVLLGASLLASWLPARRAAAVEPMHALRTE